MSTLTPGEPCLTYVGLSRVTTIDGLYITDRCESKIAVNPAVKAQMRRLRTEAHLKLSISPIYSYETDQNTLKICFLNSRSLHRPIEGTRKDLNYSIVNVNMFSETGLNCSAKDTDYA